jgi:hypothetical protein
VVVAVLLVVVGPNMTNSSLCLWFYRWSVMVVVLLVMVGPTTTNSTATTMLQR